MAIVLDLDMDLFLPEISRRYNDRKNHDHLAPWDEKGIRNFLEMRCGLSVSQPLPGRIMESHDDVFRFWRELIEQGTLLQPFAVVHADAHADLGIGDASWTYIAGELLHEPPENRAYPKENSPGLAEGNYLVFAIACRWISRLTYVYHHKNRAQAGTVGLRDIPEWAMKDRNLLSGVIQLKKLRPEDIRRSAIDRSSCEVLALEPQVPLQTVMWREYEARQPFDLLCVARSPHYTPAALDALVPVVEQYISPI